MTFEDFPEANFTYPKPKFLNDEEADSLRVFTGNLNSSAGVLPVIVSKWKPSYEDLLDLNNGGSIYLVVLGHTMPAVSVSTDNPFQHDASTCE